MAKEQFGQAERLYREALNVDAEALAPGHARTGMARIQLGRALAGQQRYPDAEERLTAGMDILLKDPRPPASWIRTAREHLAGIHEALDRPEQAQDDRKH